MKSRTVTRFGVALLFVLTAATAALRAGDPERLAGLRAEKAKLEARLEEIDVEIDKLWSGDGVKALGMTLIDQDEKLRKKYDLHEKFSGPIVTTLADASAFLANTAPTEGCTFWLVEHPEHSFFPAGECGPATSFHPKTVRQFLRAVVDSAISPEEYQAMYDRFNLKSLERVENFKDQPEVRERLLKMANTKMPAEDVGKYVCRVVYGYPKKAGTMTTHLRLTREDVDALKAFLAK